MTHKKRLKSEAKMTQNMKEDIKIEIISVLLESSMEGLGVSEIGEKIKKDRQTVHYHLKELRKLGLVLKCNSEKYCLQMILYKNTEEFGTLYKELKNVYNKASELLILDNTENKDKATTDNISLFLLLHIKSELD